MCVRNVSVNYSQLRPLSPISRFRTDLPNISFGSSLVETATNSVSRSRGLLMRSQSPNQTCITPEVKPAARSQNAGALIDDSIRAGHSSPGRSFLESSIMRATRSDAFFENVRNEKPLPIAEKPLRLSFAISFSIRKTSISAFIRTSDPPSDMGRRTSIWTTAFAGGQVAVKTKAPAALMSRVKPSPWNCTLSGPSHRKMTEVFIR
jgi:hypothetical protein